MVVDDLDIVCASVAPHETDPPSLVDTDTPLAFPRTFQLFQAVAGRYAHVFNKARVVQHTKLPKSDRLNVGRQPAAPNPLPNRLSFAIAKAPDHVSNV
jgi:hypothetical protein